MRVGLFRWTVGLLFLIAEPLVASGPVFESKVVRLSVLPDAVDAALEWRCENTSEIPLVIEGYEQSCGCLVGGVEDFEIAPGRTGAVKARFTPGPYRGLVRKSLHVRFVGFEKPVELVAEITIPSTVELSVRDLSWVAGERAEKRIEIKAGTKLDFQITGVSGVDGKPFKLEQEVVEKGRHYRLKVTPEALAPPGHHILQLRTDSTDRRDQMLAVFLKIEEDGGRETGGDS